MNEGSETRTRPGQAAERIVIVGAGTSGLALASELALRGIPCRVLERCGWQKENSTTPGNVQSVARLLSGASDPTVGLTRPGGRFAHTTLVADSAVEDLLQMRAHQLGVEIIRPAEVIDVDQDADGVTVRARGEPGEWQERAAYVVGCDGADSIVRKLSGIPVEGKTHSFAAVLADASLRWPPDAELMVHGSDKGVMGCVACADGSFRVVCIDRTRRWADEPATQDELRASLWRVTGRDLEPYEARWMTRLRLHERLAARYRDGRVLLAGNAAHLHSPVSGHGLDIGIQDSFNLGWKLAAVLDGWASPWLLDSYESERRPVAERAIRATGGVTATVTTPSAFGGAMRGFTPSGRLPLVSVESDMPSISLRYPAPGEAGHLAGRWLPDLQLSLPDGAVTRLYDLLCDGRLGLLDLGPFGASAVTADGWSDRVRPIVADLLDPVDLRGAVAVLVRPDGYAAWSTDAPDPEVRAAECGKALTRWCGDKSRSGTGALAGAAAGYVAGAVPGALSTVTADPGAYAVRPRITDPDVVSGGIDAIF